MKLLVDLFHLVRLGKESSVMLEMEATSCSQFRRFVHKMLSRYLLRKEGVRI